MEFSTEQQKIIHHGAGPLLVVAGPGSGKTAVILQRVQELMNKRLAEAEQILVITFSKSAAEEMRQRFLKIAGSQYGQPCFGTFHAIFLKILRESAGYKNSDIVTEKERYYMLRESLHKLAPEKQFEQEELTSLLAELGRAKNAPGLPENYVPRSCEPMLFRQMYKEYARQMEQEHKLDFDDILLQCYQLLREEPMIRAYWQNRYRYILVDEFQDANRLQYETVRLLAEPAQNLVVVGDDDQSIYAFRGAEPGLMKRFRSDYPKAPVLQLGENFRSAISVTKTAGQLIGHNRNRQWKKLTSHSASKGVVEIHSFRQKTEEYEQVAQLAMSNPTIPLEEQAVLYRTNHQPRRLAEYLLGKNVPFTLQDRLPGLAQHWITQDMLSYMRLAAGDTERVQYLRVCNRPKRYLPRECFREIPITKESILRVVAGRPELCAAVERLFYDLSMLERMNPFAAINYIRRAVDYEGWLLAYAKEHHLDYMELQEILEELQDSARNLATFTQWEEKLEQTQEELKNRQKGSRNGLSLMTFHAAKGLEFKRVFLIDLNDGIVPHRRSETTEGLEEERRILYVAMTRAKEELYLFYPEEHYGKRLEPSRFLRELQ